MVASLLRQQGFAMVSLKGIFMPVSTEKSLLFVPLALVFSVFGVVGFNMNH
jgi:hypothetical protein